MGRANFIRRAFNGGQVSERVEDRADLPKVQSGLRRAQNVMVTAQGTATRRPGWEMIAPAKYPDKRCRLIPFRFSVDQAYITEAGDGYMRFFKDGGQILDASSEVYEISSQYVVADLPKLQWAQSNDVQYIVSGTKRPNSLTRSGHAAWTLTQLGFTDGPYMTQNFDTTITLTPAATTGSATNLTASVPLFAATDVGRYIRLRHGSTWGWGIIVSVTSTMLAAVNIGTAFGGTSATSIWRLGAWYGTLWPVAVALFQGRAWYAGGSDPTRLVGSVIQEHHNLTLGTLATDAVEFRIEGADQLAIQWLHGTGATLMVGAASAAYALKSGKDDPTISVDAGNASLQSSDGSATGMMARSVGDEVVFVSRGQQRLMAAGYRYDIDRYRPGDLTTYVPEITLPGIADVAYQDVPERIMWVARTDGVLLSCTYNADQQVLAWAYHPTDGAVESIAVIPGPDRDELWASIARPIGGVTTRFIERLAQPWVKGDAIASAFYVDCGDTYSGAPATVISNLTYLAGKEVDILADGFWQPRQTVSGTGTITLKYPASTVTVGLPYRVVIDLTDPDVGARDGSAQGRRRRIVRAAVDVLDSSRCRIGHDEDHLSDISGFPRPEKWGQPPALYTGELRTLYAGGWEYGFNLMVVHDAPLPFTIRSISFTLSVSEN